MKGFFMYGNVVALAIAYALMIIAPSWGAVFCAIGWTAAWYYHFVASRFIQELIDEGILIEDDDE